MAMDNPEKSPQSKRAYWQEQIERWKQSGLSQRAYCRHNGLKYRQWVYWKKRTSSVEKPIMFVPLRIAEAPEGSVIRVITPNGFKIELEGACAASIGRLIREVAII